MPLAAKDYVCGSCAGGEISSLSTHKNARDAMIHFCKMVLGMPGDVKAGFYKSSLSGANMFNQSASHYVFIAGPEEISSWKNYGTEFATFITANKLGLVATLPPIRNRKYHPSTDCKIWIWQPDQKGLETWWLNEGSTELRAEAERVKKAAEVAKQAKEETLKGERIKYARVIIGHTKNGVEPTIVRHHNAYSSSLKTYKTSSFGVGALNQTITVAKLHRGYLLMDGTQEYSHQAVNGSNYTSHHSGPLLTVGATYKIVYTDTINWVLVAE